MERTAGGNDFDVAGGGGADKLSGGLDNDLLAPERGDDVVRGGLGLDTFLPSGGSDVADGGRGATA